MHAEPESRDSETATQQEQLFARLQPESELEERLVRQIALCRSTLAYIEALLHQAAAQLHTVTAEPKDAPAS